MGNTWEVHDAAAARRALGAVTDFEPIYLLLSSTSAYSPFPFISTNELAAWFVG